MSPELTVTLLSGRARLGLLWMSAPEWEDKQRTDYTEPFGKLPRLTS
jgi:hypothetical protein